MRPLIYKDGKKPVRVTAENKKYPKKSIFGYCKDNATCRGGGSRSWICRRHISPCEGEIAIEEKRIIKNTLVY